jgi:hypothetical protein
LTQSLKIELTQVTTSGFLVSEIFLAPFGEVSVRQPNLSDDED